jgi:Zn-dependent metalloprotease
MCPDCWKKEQDTHNETMKPENQQARVDAMNKAMTESRKLDSTIEVRSDLFNAATVSIIDLKKLIDDNPTITNKPFALAETLTERFSHFKKVIFDANESIIEATNNQKAIQVYLNNLANSLRAEEREKLKLADINYKPGAVKPVKTVSTVKVRKASTKLDKKELDKYAKELGVSAFTLQMLCVSQGITPEMAANKLRKSIKESLSESTPDNEKPVEMGSESE